MFPASELGHILGTAGATPNQTQTAFWVVCTVVATSKKSPFCRTLVHTFPLQFDYFCSFRMSFSYARSRGGFLFVRAYFWQEL